MTGAVGNLTKSSSDSAPSAGSSAGTVKDTVERTTATASDGADRSAPRATGNAGAGAGDTVERVVGGTVDRGVGETVDRAVGGTVGETVDRAVGGAVDRAVRDGGEVVASAGDSVDRAVREIGASGGTASVDTVSNAVRDFAGVANPDAGRAAEDSVTAALPGTDIDDQVLAGISQPSPPTPTAVATQSFGDASAPSPGAVDAPVPTPAETGPSNDPAAGIESTPAAGSPERWEVSPDTRREPLPTGTGRLSGSSTDEAPGGSTSPGGPTAAPASSLVYETGVAATTAQASVEPPAASARRDQPSVAIGGLRFDLPAATFGLASELAAGLGSGAATQSDAPGQDAPSAPPTGATGIAAGISAAASSSLLLVLASVLVLWLAGPALRLRPRIAAAPPVPFVSLLERPG